MRLYLRNKRQAEIAELLWEAQEPEEVSAILEKYGNDAVSIYHLIVAEYLDTVEPNVDINDLLNSFMKRE